MPIGRKLWMVGGLLGSVGCALGLLLVLALLVFGGPSVVCVAGTNASLTARGPLAFYFSREWRKSKRMLSCGSSEPIHLPLICQRQLLGTEITVHDRGFLGITLVGSDLCQQLQQAQGAAEVANLRPPPAVSPRDRPAREE